MPQLDEDLKNVLNRYSQKLSSEEDQSAKPLELFSREYEIFRRESLVFTQSFYERMCASAEKIIRVSPKKEEAEEIQEAIDTCHLNVTPVSAYSLAILVMIGAVLFGLFIGLVLNVNALLAAQGMPSIPYLPMEPSAFIPLFLIIVGVILVKPLSRYPTYCAAKWRLQATNQMVLCILYVVIYMRHTSNLELAIKFAAEHLEPPLSLDLRKVFWDVETQKFSSMKDSLDSYLEYWRKYNMDFVESFHLIESSLFESNNQRRIDLLEKSLEVMLEGTYEKMLHYAHDAQNPITTLHMLGVILPILGLIILPLLGSFMGVKWYHLALLYNVLLPVTVYFMGYRILAKRPVGYAQTKIFDENPAYIPYKMVVMKTSSGEKLVDPKPIAILMCVAFVLIAFAPFIYHQIDPAAELKLGETIEFFGYLQTGEKAKVVGPFGLGMALTSLLIPLGLAFGIGYYFKVRSNRLMVIREETNKLEKEFVGALFQLGNTIENGIPAELVFDKVAHNMKGTPTGNFLKIVDNNIRRLGMNVESAIFDKKIGAIISFPSSVIETSMKILIDSARKGPTIVAKAILSLSSYMDRINKVAERLKDLLADIVSSMKAQISFLTPAIAGIVVGISNMMTALISKLTMSMAQLGGGDAAKDQFGALGGLTELFPLEDMISPFFFQLVVGLYVVEIIIVLSVLSNGIENGVDKLTGEYQIGKNLYKSVVLYVIIAALTTFIFSMLAAKMGAVGA